MPAGVHLLPTYQLRPLESEKFSPSAAQRVAERVLVEELKGKVYEEERVTNWAVAIAEVVKQGVKCEFWLGFRGAEGEDATGGSEGGIMFVWLVIE